MVSLSTCKHELIAVLLLIYKHFLTIFYITKTYQSDIEMVSKTLRKTNITY